MNQILVMSNDPILKRKNLEILIENGFQVTDVSDALDGLLMVDKDGFSAIIIDEELADIDGYRAAQKIRQYSQIPIILLGSETPEDVWSRVDELGFDIYLKKPVSPRELVSQVKSVVRRLEYERGDGPHQEEIQDNALESARPHAAGEQIADVEPSESQVLKVESATEQPTGLSDIEEAVSGGIAKKAEDEPPISSQDMVGSEQGKDAVGKLPVPPEDTPLMSMEILEETKNIKLDDTAIPDTVGQTEQGAEKPSLEVWTDARMAKLVDALASGKYTEIHPIIDTSAEEGFAYPEIERLINADQDETRFVLEALAKENVLNKTPFEKVHMDPDGSLQLIPVERCPNCGSGNLLRGQLIEHFYCGNVGMEQDYKVDHKYNCPKCNRELKLLGTDYRNIGIRYKCLDCKEIFPSPVIKWRNLKTGKVWDFEVLQEIQLYSYVLNPDRKDWLEFQLKPKAKLVEFLKIRGYQVEEMAKIHSSSGAVHTIDILASRDDGLAKYYLGIEVLIALRGKTEVDLEELFEFDTKAYDMGLNYKVVIAMPKLSSEAAKFASRQKIGVFEANDPAALISFLSRQSLTKSSVLNREATQYFNQIGTSTGPRGQIAAYLWGRGYEVHENARIQGKSGAEHAFDIFAQRDDVIIKPAVVVAVVTVGKGHAVGIDKVSQFDAEAFDAGIRNKVVIGIPQVGPEAKQFARQQRIKVVEESELAGLLHT